MFNKWFKRLDPIKVIILVLFLLRVATMHAQDKGLQLEQCYKLAEQNYPLVKQRALIKKSGEYSVANISKGSLPQLNIAGQASYQSDVTALPISLPGIKVPELSKDQYKLYGEINQPLTDLATVSQQKEIQQANTAIQAQNLEVELYRIRERINQLFFGILLLDEQLIQNDLLQKDIETGIRKIQAAVNNGTELRSSLDKMNAELLRIRQRNIELRASRKAYTDMLSLFIAQTLDENAKLEKPVEVFSLNSINRPELKVFDFQKQSYELQDRLINIRNLPRFSLFLQGGFGRPALNMLDNSFAPYYIGGIRLNWSLSNFYTSGKDKKLIGLNKSMVDAQRENFLFNTNLSLKQQQAEMNKLRELIKTDQEIVNLRNSVKNTSAVQLENGVITVNDYLREVNAEDQARQNSALHQLQLLIAQYSYQNISGN